MKQGAPFGLEMFSEGTIYQESIREEHNEMNHFVLFADGVDVSSLSGKCQRLTGKQFSVNLFALFAKKEEDECGNRIIRHNNRIFYACKEP